VYVQYDHFRKMRDVHASSDVINRLKVPGVITRSERNTLENAIARAGKQRSQQEHRALKKKTTKHSHRCSLPKTRIAKVFSATFFRTLPPGVAGGSFATSPEGTNNRCVFRSSAIVFEPFWVLIVSKARKESGPSSCITVIIPSSVEL